MGIATLEKYLTVYKGERYITAYDSAISLSGIYPIEGST